MRVFLRVAERGSLTAASADMGLARGGASAIVKELESYMGVQLLARTTRSLRLTPEGELYCDRARAILADLTALEDEIGGAERKPRGMLRVQIPFGLTRLIVAPALAGFTSRYPDLEINILSRNSLPDFVGDRLDAAVYAGDVPERDLVARSVGRIPFATVASPSYLARRGAPCCPADLAQHNCIGILSSATGLRTDWQFRIDGHDRELPMTGTLAFEAAEAAVAAAVRGAGIVQLAGYLVYEEIKSGALVPLMPGAQARGYEVRILHPRHRHKPRKLRVFEDFLLELNANFRRRWRISDRVLLPPDAGLRDAAPETVVIASHIMATAPVPQPGAD